MLLWRLSGRRHAASFDGGYGLHFDGRWNSAGHAVTYCATAPSLCVLEKLVHVEDPALLPDLRMITYEVPDDVGVETLTPGALPPDWRRRESWTQQHGDAWHRAAETLLLRVPSVIVPLAGAPDVNVLVNHRHADIGRIRTLSAEPFTLDARLFGTSGQP